MPNSVADHTTVGLPRPASPTPPRFVPVRRDTEPADGTPVVVGFGGPVSTELPPQDVDGLLSEYGWIVNHVVGKTPTHLLAAAGLDADDLKQEGAIGLLSAARTFDPMRSARFSPYARTVVSNAVFGALRHHDPLAETVRRDLREVARYIEEHTTQRFAAPSLEQVAEGTGLSIDRVRTIRGQAALTYAIQAGDNENVDGADPTAALVHEGVEDECAIQDLWTALSALDERDRRIVWARSVEGRTVRDVAGEESISIGRVSQIHGKALQRLRAALLSTFIGLGVFSLTLLRSTEFISEQVF